MTMFTLYDRATGRIVGHVSSQKTAEANAATVGFIEGRFAPERFWVKGGKKPKAVAREPMNLTVDGFRISGLPKGATINGVPMAKWAPPDGDLAPRVLIEAPRHIPQTLILKDYRALRAESYPPAGEQLGAYAKIAKAMMEGAAPPADAVAVLAQIDAVKAAHPKT
jgi:hypothetical protein